MKEHKLLNLVPLFAPYFPILFDANPGGFLSPIKQSVNQQQWNQQVAISYLLGLDWTIPQQWQHIREREHTLPVRLTDATEDGGLFGMRF